MPMKSKQKCVFTKIEKSTWIYLNGQIRFNKSTYKCKKTLTSKRAFFSLYTSKLKGDVVIFSWKRRIFNIKIAKYENAGISGIVRCQISVLFSQEKGSGASISFHCQMLQTEACKQGTEFLVISIYLTHFDDLNRLQLKHNFYLFLFLHVSSISMLSRDRTKFLVIAIKLTLTV